MEEAGADERGRECESETEVKTLILYVTSFASASKIYFIVFFHFYALYNCGSQYTL